MNRRRKIVFINNYPIDKRDVQRFGLKILVSHGFDIEIYDVSTFYYTNLLSESITNLQDFKITSRKMQTLQQVKKKIKELTKNDVLIVAGSSIKIVSVKTYILHKLLSSSKAIYGAILWGDHPIHSVTSLYPKANRSPYLIIGKIARNITNKKYLKSAMWREINNSAILASLFKKLKIFKPFNIIWLGTLVERIPKRCTDINTQVKFVHSFDYDRFLETSEIVPGTENKIVFLDSMGPMHTDFIVESRSSAISIDEYVATVNGFINKFELTLDEEIVIAAHPRSNIDIAKRLYGERKIFFDKTPELISGSKAVIAIDGSTAIGYAVLWEKPLIILNSRKLDLETQEFNKLFCALLSPIELNLDDEYTIPQITPINAELYKSYRENYLKKKNTPEKLFWKIVVDDINSLEH